MFFLGNDVIEFKLSIWKVLDSWKYFFGKEFHKIEQFFKNDPS